MLLRTLALSNEALSLEPENAKAHFRRACALESLERFSEAYLAYQTAALLAPMDARVRESLERASRYDASELGPEISAEVAARKTAEHAAQVRKRQLQKQKMMRAIAKEEVNETAVPKAGFNLDGSPLATCCWCTRGCRGGDFYAAPCGHGPFCGACRGRISEEGHNLPMCPVCRRSASATADCTIIREWQKGAPQPFQPLPATGMPAPPGPNSSRAQRRKAFGPRRPPEMVVANRARQKTFPALRQLEEEENCAAAGTELAARIKLLHTEEHSGSVSDNHRDLESEQEEEAEIEPAETVEKQSSIILGALD
ncbi:unnamed protein product [Polarella glacialis]|uniref:RING-type domain-containing protein n=1 Tax=Polarella glacialis TaxID=89957 RepID=A0A813F7U6_POLGL|nr:unnamed protein product [Polarella glacialis]